MNSIVSSKKVKCMMLIPRMGPGGAERVLATLANQLSLQNYEIIIVTLTDTESFYRLNPMVRVIGANYEVNRKNKLTIFKTMTFNGLKSLLFINRIINDIKPDIILSFLTHTNILALLIHLYQRRIPLVISERAEPQARGIFFRIVCKYFYPMANCLVCQSNTVTKFFPRYAKHRIHVIPNPINEECIPKDKPNKRRKSIVAVGRLFPQKNFDLLIDSFSDIKDEFPDHILEIYGEGYLRNDLQKKIDNLGLSERIFLLGVKKDVMKFIYDSELFVMSSDFEGFPNVLVEAMASGLPVISTDFSTGVAQELITNENGILVPVADRIAMSKAIRMILSDGNMQKIMSDKNREILDTLSTEKIVGLWTRMFDEIRK